MRGKEPMVGWDNDKSTVVALREIAAGYTQFDNVDQPEKAAVVQLSITNTEKLVVRPTNPSHEQET